MKKKLKIGINGMGRIGRTLLRQWVARKDSDLNHLEIHAVNNPGRSIQEYLHLLRYDSVHGTMKNELIIHEDSFTLDGSKIYFHQSPSPSEIPWEKQEIDIVIDATVKFKNKESLSQHLRQSVKKVIMCAPGEDLNKETFVMGINQEKYDPKNHHVISNASCTTNCLAPIAKVLQEKFGILSGLMTTIHSYTADQNLLDSAHKDIRRARAAGLSMIPTTTGAAKALGLVIPELTGKLDGLAVRVPTADVSIVDLTVHLAKSATKDEINNAMKEAATNGPLKGILGINSEKLVSIDFTGRSESAVFDETLTYVKGDIAKVQAWYDNEVGFSNRVLDLTCYVGERL